MKDNIAIVISVIAIIISIISIYKQDQHNKRTIHISEESNNREIEKTKPTIRISSILFDPNKAILYGGSRVDWQGKHDFLKEHPDILDKTKRQYLKKYIPRINTLTQKEEINKYLLINLCMDEYEEERILMLDALKLSFEIEGQIVNEVSIKSVYSMATESTSFDTELSLCPITFYPENNKLSISIAYASWCNRTSSLFLHSLNDKINSSEKKEIELLEETYAANGIICFIETGYLLEIKCENDNIYEYSLFLERDNVEMKPYKIYKSRKEFDIRSANACKRANTDVVIRMN